MNVTEAHRLAFEPTGDPWLDLLFAEDPTCHYHRFLYWLARTRKPMVMVELGTGTGRAAAHLAAGNPDGTVVTADPEEHGGIRPNTAPYPNVVFHKCRSDDPGLLAEIADGSVGLCFVDSVHAVDYALREVSLWTPKMERGGIFVFDDLEWDDGMRTLLGRLPFREKGNLPDLHTMGFGYAIV